MVKGRNTDDVGQGIYLKVGEEGGEVSSSSSREGDRYWEHE